MSADECPTQAPCTPQAVGSSTFTPPPYDVELGLHEVYDFHLKNSPTHPLFVWDSGSSGLQTLTWGEVARGSHRAAHFINRHAKAPAGDKTPPVIAILASTDMVTSICLMLGLIRAGYQAFCISPRNSIAGVSHLLDIVGSSELIVHDDGPLYALAAAAIARSNNLISLLPLPVFADFFPEDEENFTPFVSTPLKDLDTLAIIMHSSGSTSFPKPRTFTHRILIQQSRVPWFGQVDICNEVIATLSVPMFHAQGLYNSCLPVSSGAILGIFAPGSPSAPPTPEKMMRGIVATNSTILITTPSYLEHLAQFPEHVATLSRLKAIFCGGAPLNQVSATVYHESRAPIICYLAATEYGIATLVVPEHAVPEGSEWLRFSPHLSPVFLPQEDPEVYELTFIASPTHTPCVINTQIDGRDAYATNDLFMRHASNPALWRVHGRTDDQIMLSTGEKTNPGPIEAIIGNSPHVKSCIMFGRGRFQSGIIVEPTQAFKPSDAAALSKFRSNIWPEVEEANKFAPSHSRIFKEMIIVSHPSKPIEYTLKQTPKRQHTIAAYQVEIDATYAAVAESAQEDIPPPASWTVDNILLFVRRVVLGVQAPGKSAVGDEDDVFSRGYDSLQATWIRNSIIRGLRESSKHAIAKELPLNFVYEHPSVAALSSYLVNAVSGHAVMEHVNGHDVSRKLRLMEDLVTKYTTHFPTHSSSRPAAGPDAPSREVVVLTGSTGSLGSQILASLVEDAGVSRVYALNRRTAVPVQKRQAVMWEDHGLDPLLLTSEKIVFVELDAEEGPWLSNDISEEIRTSATMIIHNAWSMDFNLALASFEPNLRTLRALVDLALQSSRVQSPLFIFTSTIGVFRNWSSPSAVPEDSLPDMALSIGAGYTESKCVAERILESASSRLRTIVVRVGQLAGAPNGSWRTSEWVPAMIKSGTTLGALPDVPGNVSWIPLRAAARALLEASRSDPDARDRATFVHLVHPHPVSWLTVVQPMADALGVQLLPYYEWLQLLERSTASGAVTPASRLLGFFRSVREREGGGDAMGFPSLETRETVARAPRALENELEVLGPKHAQRWIGHWRQGGFL